jgi:hypothetical protein
MTLCVLVAMQLTAVGLLAKASGLLTEERYPRTERHKNTPVTHPPSVARVIERFENKDLATIFLTNDGPLSKDTRAQMTETGVLHHLAISAGQLVPIMLALDQMFRPLFRWGMRATLRTPAFARSAAMAAATGGLFTLYGATGSLLRLVVLAGLRTVFVSLLVMMTMRASALWSRPTKATTLLFETIRLFTRFQAPFLITALVVTATCGRNLLADWSFLYASLGAASCSFGITLAMWLGKRLRFNRPFARFLVGLVIMQACATMAMMPLSRTNFFSSCLANFICGPLVSLAIVPPTVTLTLLARAGVPMEGNLGLLYESCILLADGALGLFREIVSTLAQASTDPDVPLLKAFSAEAYGYTVVLVVMVWLGPQIKDAFGRTRLGIRAKQDNMVVTRRHPAWPQVPARSE